MDQKSRLERYRDRKMFGGHRPRGYKSKATTTNVRSAEDFPSFLNHFLQPRKRTELPKDWGFGVLPISDPSSSVNLPEHTDDKRMLITTDLFSYGT